jgi:hypothetical protein
VKTIEIPAKCDTLTGISLVGLNNVTVSRLNENFVVNCGRLIDVKKKMLVRLFGGEKSILIDRSIENISTGCFYGCTSLCEVTFESDCQLKEIEKLTFHYSDIKSIRIPRNVEKIGERCFGGCMSLCEVTFESDCQLKEIGTWVFWASGLKSIRIPKTVEKIGEFCFCGCKSLCEVTLERRPEFRSIFQGCPLKVLRVPVGMDLSGCVLPKDCRIEYFEPSADEICDPVNKELAN